MGKEKARILFISQEIAPYVPESELSVFSRDLAQGLQENGCEVRTFMPKYGCINERRNQLHEVIRLTGMNLIINDTDHPLVIKVATLQPTRLQVYFIYNDDYFSRTVTKQFETLTNKEENDERSIFFVRGVFETTKKLSWEPNVIHCAGWIAALAPLYMKDVFKEEPAFASAKMVCSITPNDLPENLNKALADKCHEDGVLLKHMKGVRDTEVGNEDLIKLAIENSDGVVINDPNMSESLAQYIAQSGKPVLPYAEQLDVEAYKSFYESL